MEEPVFVFKKSRSLVAFLASVMVVASGFAGPRIVEDIDCGWRFALGDQPAWFSPAVDDSSWRLLNVPHDWSIEGDYSRTNSTTEWCGYLPSGVAWYRREFQVTNDW